MARNLTLGVAEYVLMLKDEMSGVASAAFDKVDGKGSSISQRFGMVGVAATAMGGAIVGALGMAVSSAAESEQAMAQLDAVLQSTGGAAGLTRDELTNLADALQKVTTYDDEAIIGAESLMLTFTKVGKEVFPEAIATVLDMSTALGQDLQSSTIQLGKALNDPIAGITALSRVGVSFTETQKETIKAMVETGDVLGAQKLILAELAVEFGGSATAAADTLNGSIEQLGNSFGNLMEAIGAALFGGEADGGGLKGFVQDVRDTVDSVTAWIQANPALATTITTVTGALGALLLVVGPIITIMSNIAVIGLFSNALFGVGAAASAAAGGAAVAGGAGAAAGVAGGVAAAAGGGGGLVAFGSALMAATTLAATAVIGIGVLAVALGAVAVAGYKYYEATVELKESQKSLDDTEKRYIETLRAKGVVIDETRMKSMSEAEQRAYLAAQETAERDSLARAWFTYFAGRTESETEFGRMRNLMLNESIDAEEAAFLVSQHITTDKVQMIMKASEEETDTILRELGFQRNESETTNKAIAASAAGAAKDRQDAFVDTSIKITDNEQKLANATLGLWDNVIKTIKSYVEWIWPILDKISAYLATIGASTPALMPLAAATGNVPGLATGGIVKTSGIVNVHKGERIILPAGSDVVPARHSSQVDAMMNGGGGDISINIQNVVMSNNLDVRDVGKQLGREVKKQMRVRGLSPAFGA